MVIKFVTNLVKVTVKSIPLAVKSMRDAYNHQAEVAPPPTIEPPKWLKSFDDSFLNDMDLNEALLVLDVGIEDDPETIQERFEYLMEVTELSHYLNSKVYRAKECIDNEWGNIEKMKSEKELEDLYNEIEGKEEEEEEDDL